MMNILKASAGSGKTFSLARSYITLLMKSDSRDAYRHILAVTFTNKATDEMKRRILKELYTLATAPERSPYLGHLVPSVMSTVQELKRKAEWMLVSIVNDYGSFAVSTIDKFFQQTLRAFSREIGQFTSYQVELDKNSLVDETVERIMDGLGSGGDRTSLNWILNGVKSDLSTTGRFMLDKRLKDLALSIVSENPRDTAYSKESLESLKAVCDEIISRFTEDVNQAALAVVNALEDAGILPSDTNRGFMKAVLPYQFYGVKDAIEAPTASFMDKALDPEKWFAKTKAHLIPAASDYVYGPMTEFASLFGAPYKEYMTAVTIRSQIYGLGMAEQIRNAFVEVQRDRGVISIDDTNTILHDIIDGTDTPFLYEKLGVRFEHFLLDEFQDTSGIQWENFLPLLRNSDANGNENLVVGDVKQSIYRWRGSQWDLLDSRLQKEFHVPADQITVLDGNYRTCRAIVNFNNVFFPYAAAEIDRLVGNSPTSTESVCSIYGDVVQEVRTKDTAAGRVQVAFVKGTEEQLTEIVESIREAMGRGAKAGDIAILVRGNAEGSLIAEKLVAEDIPVISDDSLFVKSSVTVRRLVSQLAIVDNPARAEQGSVEGFLAREFHIEAPKQYHCLTDLAENILSELKAATPELFDAETPFIQAFVDWLQEWSHKNGNNLGAMLRDWNEADPKIASPEGTDAVRVMTVHKSKGLEFPFVIFPFAEKVTLYKPTSYWCRPEVNGTALEAVADGRYRASLSDGSMNTLFREDYIRERSQQAVDNINVFYVAMTRAKCELKVISAMPPKAVTDAVKAGSPTPAKALSHLLFAYVLQRGVDEQMHFATGEPYDYTTLTRVSDGPRPITLTYAVSGNGSRRRLCFRTSNVEPEEAPTEAVPAQENQIGPSTGETVVEPTLF